MENKEIIIGESCVIECMRSGSPTPKIHWYKNDEPIEPSNRHFLTANDQILVITSTTEKDSGTYMCIIENSIGQMNASMQLFVRTTLSIDADDSYVKGINVDEMTAIVIITVVCCAIGTSIIWVIIIYQTKKEGGCTTTTSTTNNSNNRLNQLNSMQRSFDKDNFLISTNISMIPKGNGQEQIHSAIYPMLQPMRTATISNSHGVTRSSVSSSSSCAGHSSIGISDDIFHKYKDDGSSLSNRPLHRSNFTGSTNSDDEEPNNDNEALLGTNYYNAIHYPIDGHGENHQMTSDTYVLNLNEPIDMVDGTNSQIDNDTIGGNTTTDECCDNIDMRLSTPHCKSKLSTSLSSSCHSIPPLPYNSSSGFDDESIQDNNIIKIESKGNSISDDKPVIAPVPIVARTKSTQKANKLNQLMTSFKK